MDLTTAKWRSNFLPKCIYNSVLPIITPDGRYLPCCFCHGDNYDLRSWAERQNLDIDTDMRIDGKRTSSEILKSQSYQRLRKNFTIDGSDLPSTCFDNCTINSYESIAGPNGGSKWKKYDGE